MQRLGREMQKISPSRDAQRSLLVPIAERVVDDADRWSPWVPHIVPPFDETEAPEIAIEAPKLLSALALAIRAEPRRPGLVKDFMKALSTEADSAAGMSARPEAVLGLLAFVGADLFVFYILLWDLLLRQLDP